MKTSEVGKNLIKQFEGCRLRPYQCSAKTWTIGYGHTQGVTEKTDLITQQQAEKYLTDDLVRFENAVNKIPSLTQNNFDAFVSLAFNIGVTAFNDSTAARKAQEGKYNEAAVAMQMWNKITVNGKKQISPGLSARRAAEAILFMQPDSNQHLRPKLTG